MTGVAPPPEDELFEREGVEPLAGVDRDDVIMDLRHATGMTWDEADRYIDDHELTLAQVGRLAMDAVIDGSGVER